MARKYVLHVFTSYIIVHNFLFFWLHYFGDFSIGCSNGRWWQWLRQGSSQAGNLVFYCKLLVNWHIITCVQQSSWAPKQVMPHVQKFWGIFWGWDKCMKTAKFIILRNFSLCDIILFIFAVLLVMCQSIMEC